MFPQETLKASKRDVEYLSLVDIQAAVDNVNNEVEQEQESKMFNLFVDGKFLLVCKYGLLYKWRAQQIALVLFLNSKPLLVQCGA